LQFRHWYLNLVQKSKVLCRNRNSEINRNSNVEMEISKYRNIEIMTKLGYNFVGFFISSKVKNGIRGNPTGNFDFTKNGTKFRWNMYRQYLSTLCTLWYLWIRLLSFSCPFTQQFLLFGLGLDFFYLLGLQNSSNKVCLC
jgi:hypothetical protein